MNIQRTLTFLFALLISMAAASHDIAVTNSGVTIYYTFTNNSTELAVSYRGSSDSEFSNEYTGKVVIPSSVTYSGKTYPVTSIGDNAFRGNWVTSVTIPNSVTSIGEYAFSSCYDLGSVIIPNSVKSIGIGAFAYSNLTSVNIPNSVVTIESYVFYCCDDLKSISIPSSVRSIQSDAFNSSGLTNIKIPSSVTYIGNNPFGGCTGLSSIVVDAGNPIYDSRDNCNAIIHSSYNKLVSGCEKTVIPSSVTTIGSDAFYKCSGLTSVTIPNSVTSIGNYAFYGCSGLTSVTIPNSVTSIGGRAFYGCKNLVDCYCYAKSIPSTNTNSFSETPISSATLHVPASALEDYRATAPWRGFGTIVPIEEEPTDDLQDYLDSFADTEDVLTATSYTRTFKNTQWQALYVPFSLSYSQWSTLFEVARLTGATTEGDNTQIEATLLTADDGELLANTPYLIRAKNTGRYTLNVDASKMADKTETTKVLDQLIAIKGSYSPRTSLRTNGYRCMLGGSLWYPNDSYTLPPYRWYAYPVRLRIVRNSPITIAIDGNVTSITPATASNGRQEAAPETYDLYGRRLKDVGTLPTGVYIVNGKKTVIYQR